MTALCRTPLLTGALRSRYREAASGLTSSLSPALLAELLRVLKPDGTVVLHEPGAAQARRGPVRRPGGETHSCPTQDALCAAALLAGFVAATSSAAGGVVARKPAWERGAAFSLRDRRPAASAAPATWKLSAGDEEGELVDEDTLLTAEDLQKPAKADDCEVGAAGRSACANCTCGRAEAETQGAAMPASACGSACTPLPADSFAEAAHRLLPGRRLPLRVVPLPRQARLQAGRGGGCAGGRQGEHHCRRRGHGRVKQYARCAGPARHESYLSPLGLSCCTGCCRPAQSASEQPCV